MDTNKKTKELWKNPAYRQHMSDVHKGKIHSGSFKKGHTIQNTGRTRFKVGNISPFLGVRHYGKENHKWKGDEVMYGALHDWIKREYGKPIKCENKNCIYPRKTRHGKLLIGPVRFEWANIDGIYNREKKHWKMLCASCHRLLDNNRIKL